MRIKKSIFAVIVLALISALAVFAGCKENEPTPASDSLQPFRDAYSKVVSAKEIEQEIEIMQNSLLVYERDREYVKNGSQYSVETTEKKLNDNLLTAEEAYTVTTESGTAPAAEFSSKLNLNADFLESVSADSTKLTAKVKGGKEKDVFSLTELGGVSDMSISLSTSAGNLTELKVFYTATENSKTYSVTVTISFEY